MLADVACQGNLVCYATGKQGVTLLTTTGGTTWTQQAGGGTTQQMNGISCPSAEHVLRGRATPARSSTTRTAARPGSPQTSGTTTQPQRRLVHLGDGLHRGRRGRGGAAPSAHDRRLDLERRHDAAPRTRSTASRARRRRRAARSARPARSSARADGGATWSPQTSGTTTALNAVACPSVVCYATGAVDRRQRRPRQDDRRRDLDAADEPQRAGADRHRVPRRLGTASPAARSARSSRRPTATNWLQQGNPLSGPTSALNVTASAGLGILAAACNAAKCLMGAGTQARHHGLAAAHGHGQPRTARTARRRT